MSYAFRFFVHVLTLIEVRAEKGSSVHKYGAHMKKVIVGFVILLIVAGVCAPFASGLVMEKIVTRYQNDLNEMYADTGSGVTVDIIQYDRSFSSSEIEWSIQAWQPGNTLWC